ncbi:MAG: prolyl oligopeptidase family serine peptidase [Eubacteriales bacterium]|nr:prolyl oligopeptidase family serine peptidase [Eubacteriales bacterium]
MGKKLLTAKTLKQVTYLSGLAAAGDGKRAAFVRTKAEEGSGEFRAEVVEYCPEGDAKAELVSLGEGKAPAYSPDGRYLAYLSRQSGEYQIWCREVEASAGDGLTVSGGARQASGEARQPSDEARPLSGAAWQLTTARHGVKHFQWSPDGRELVFEAPFWPEELEQGTMFTEFTPEEKEAWLFEQEMAPQVIEEIAYKRDEFFGVQDGSVFCIARVTFDGTDGTQSLVTDGSMNAYLPVYSREGNRIAYYGRPYHDAKAFQHEVFVWEEEAGERQVTKGAQLFADVPLAFLPGGQELICNGFYMAEDGFDQRLFRLSTADGTQIPLFPEKEDGSCHNINNSPIGRTVYGEESSYYQLDKAGEWVYFLSAFQGREALYRVAADGSGRVETVLRGEFSVHSFTMPVDGGLYVLAGDTVTIAELYRVELDAAGVQTAPTAPDAADSDVVSQQPAPADGDTPAPAAPDAADGDMVSQQTAPARGGALAPRLERLTFSNEWMKDYAVAVPKEIWFPSADGKVQIQGWIVMPPNQEPGKKYPAVLDIHGGPECTYVNDYWHEFQAFAAAGIAALYCNPRGSMGYGLNFASDTWSWGDEAVSDLLTMVDRAVEQEAIDPERIGVTGGSYGGYMTVKLIGTTKRFRAAAAQRCLCNLATSYGTGDMGFESAKTDDLSKIRMLDVLTKRARTSLIRHIDEIKIPLLILHGYRDYRCGFEQAEQLFIAMKERNPEVPVRMVVYPKENHGVTREGTLSNQISHLSEMVNWFSKYLEETSE